MPFDIEAAARLLIDAHRDRKLVAAPEPPPGSVADAYAVQDAVVRELGPVGGWKVGAKTPSEEPAAAPILARLVRPGPCTWPASDFHMMGVEAEIAFRIGRDIEPGSRPLEDHEVRDAVGSIHAAIEIVDTRLLGWRGVDRLWAMADNQTNGGFVHAPDGVPWTGQDLASAPVRLLIDGETRIDRAGGNPAGDPVRLVAWFLDHARRRSGVPAGTFITTGSYTGMIFVEPGARIEAEFAGIGRVSLDLSDG